MSFFHKKNVTKCLGHHYTIWTSDSKKKFSDQPKLALISGTAMSNGQTKTKLFYNCML